MLSQRRHPAKNRSLQEPLNQFQKLLLMEHPCLFVSGFSVSTSLSLLPLSFSTVMILTRWTDTCVHVVSSIPGATVLVLVPALPLVETFSLFLFQFWIGRNNILFLRPGIDHFSSVFVSIHLTLVQTFSKCMIKHLDFLPNASNFFTPERDKKREKYTQLGPHQQCMLRASTCQDYVHTRKRIFFLCFGPPSTPSQCFSKSSESWGFRKRSPEWINLKTHTACFSVSQENRSFVDNDISRVGVCVTVKTALSRL